MKFETGHFCLLLLLCPFFLATTSINLSLLQVIPEKKIKRRGLACIDWLSAFKSPAADSDENLTYFEAPYSMDSVERNLQRRLDRTVLCEVSWNMEAHSTLKPRLCEDLGAACRRASVRPALFPSEDNVLYRTYCINVRENGSRPRHRCLRCAEMLVHR